MDKLTAYRRFQQNPQAEQFRILWDLQETAKKLPEEAKRLAEEAIANTMAEYKTSMENEVSSSVQDFKRNLTKISDNVDQEILNLIQAKVASLDVITVKGDKGDMGMQGAPGIDGKDGKTPSQKEISNKVRTALDAALSRYPLFTESKIINLIKNTVAPFRAKNEANAIVSAISSLPETEKLGIPAIRGLSEALKKLGDNIRYAAGTQGGGGMGNPQHDQFSGDGSTTTFTLTYNVAAAGTAVFGCRYQGQSLFLGDQFTISGKTLTMVGFTPANGTKVEITYIRT